MRLGKHDGRSTAQHVQQYINNLPAGLKNLVVTQTVTNLDLYQSLTLGQQFDRFLKLDQTWLAASTVVQPSGNVRPAQQRQTGANKRAAHAGQKRTRDEAEAPAAASARPAACPEGSPGLTSAALGPSQWAPLLTGSALWPTKISRHRRCYFCWEKGHAFAECPEIPKHGKSYILSLRCGKHAQPAPFVAYMSLQNCTQEQSAVTGANAIPIDPQTKTRGGLEGAALEEAAAASVAAVAAPGGKPGAG